MLGIYYNDKHSYNDFGITIKSKEIGFPSPNLIYDTVPFLHGTYDFSNLYGEITYSERSLKYVFNIIKMDKVHMNQLKIKVVNWLKASEKNILIDDDIIGYYFLAQPLNYSFSENNFVGELTIEFVAYPFKIKNEFEGKLLWDTFNFENDVFQEVEFNVNNFKEIILYNTGSKILYPNIICDEEIEILKDDYKYIVKPNSNNNLLKLDLGLSKMTLVGNGTVKFEFRKEVL